MRSPLPQWRVRSRSRSQRRVYLNGSFAKTLAEEHLAVFDEDEATEGEAPDCPVEARANVLAEARTSAVAASKS